MSDAQPLFLCIETSSPICSVALGKGDTCFDEKTSEEPNGHSKMLTVMVDEIMRNNHLSFSDLDAVVVNAGPGSYTGLRIGMSTAKGLCYAAEKPLIVISAFDSMIHSFLNQFMSGENDLLVPMIDARRMEVYTQVFDSKGNSLDDQKSYISKEEDLFRIEPKGKVWLFGSGAEKMVADLSHYNVELASGQFISASGLIKIANRRFAEKQFDDVAYTTPNYGKAWQKI
jgi:tRNA threonylcarbamoyladenosine biosynthesis protein TsaB